MPGSDGSAQLGPWVEGVRYDLPSEDISPFGLKDMQNVRLTVAGAGEKRLGVKSYSDVAALGGAPTVTSTGEFQIPGGASKVFMAAGNKFYEYSSGWVDRTGSVTITPGVDNVYEWVRAGSSLVMTNGVDTDAFKWSGTGDATVLDDDARFTKGKHIAYWDNRLWIGNEDTNIDRLWYSEIGDIEDWPATNFYNLGSPITALAPMQNGLSIHTEDAIHSLIPTGNATIPYQLQQRTSSDPQNPQRGGSLSGRAVVTLPNDLQVFPLDDGIYIWDGGTNVQKISHALDLGYWDQIITSRLAYSFAVYFAAKNEVWFWLPYGKDQTTMNHIMVMSTKLKYQDPVTGDVRYAWYGPHNGSGATFDRACAAIINNKPHAGTFTGKVLDHSPERTYSDEGAAIAAFMETGAPAPIDAGTNLRWLWGDIYHDGLGAYTILVHQEAANIEVQSGTFVTLIGGGAFPFDLGVDKLGTVRAQIRQINLVGYDPHTSLKFANTEVDEPFRMRRARVHFAIIGPHRRA